MWWSEKNDAYLLECHTSHLRLKSVRFSMSKEKGTLAWNEFALLLTCKKKSVVFNFFIKK